MKDSSWLWGELQDKKKTPASTIWFSLTQNTIMYERPSLSGCDDVECVWYVTQVWLSANLGKFVETPVWRGAIQFSVYKAGRPRNVLCSFSYRWNWNWLHQQLHCNKLFFKSESKISFLFKLKLKPKKQK